MRRRKKDDTQGSYDSVLDTMTNVVGILIIIVAVTQLGVGDAVRSARARTSGIVEVTEEQLAEAQLEEARLRGLLDAVKQRYGTLSVVVPEQEAELLGLKEVIRKLEAFLEEPGLATLAREVEELERGNAELSRRIDSPGPPAITREQAERQLAEVKANAERLAVEIAAARGKTAKQGAELGKLKAARVRSPVVSLPTPDPARGAGKTIFVMLCKGGKVYPMDIDAMNAKMNQAFPVAWARVPAAGTWADRFGQVARILNTQDLGTDCIRAEFVVIQRPAVVDNTQIDADLVRRFDVRAGSRGDAIGDLKKPGSRLRMLATRAPAATHWLFFYVEPDSFDVYLEARTEAEKLGYAVGWDPLAVRLEWSTLGGTTGGRTAAPD